MGKKAGRGTKRKVQKLKKILEKKFNRSSPIFRSGRVTTGEGRGDAIEVLKKN